MVCRSSQAQGFVENLHQHVHVFVLLSVGKDHRLHADLAAFRQRGDDSIEVQGRDGLVGHHQRGVPRHVLAEKVSPGEQARTDVDRIRSIPSSTSTVAAGEAVETLDAMTRTARGTLTERRALGEETDFNPKALERSDVCIARRVPTVYSELRGEHKRELL